MKKLACRVLTLMITSVLSLPAQSVDRPKPGFALSIEGEKSPQLGYPPGTHVLLVKYTNISDQIEERSSSDSEDWLNMIVLFDGAPAPETELMRSLKKSRSPVPSSGSWIGSVQFGKKLQPKESVTWDLWISEYFDMTRPGTYTITVNRETYPGEPEKSVTVWSNTYTISEPPAKTPSAAQEVKLRHV